MTRHIASIRAISNATSFLRSLWIQLTSSNATTLRPTGLEPTRSASSLPSLNVTSFDLVTSWSIRRSEVKSGSWKNNRRENPIVFSIAFSFTTNWILRCALDEYLFYYHTYTLYRTTWPDLAYLAWSYEAEIIWLSTFPKFLSFVHVTLHVTRLLPFMLSIPPRAIVRAVGTGLRLTLLHNCRKPVLKRPAFSPAHSLINLSLKTLIPALIIPLNNNFFQEFIWSFMKKA